MLKIFKIKGDSCFPLYKNSQIILALNTRFLKLRPKDVVVFLHKEHGLMVKQIQHIKDDDFYLVGTLPQSVDSRNFGFIQKKNIKYKVLCKLF